MLKYTGDIMQEGERSTYVDAAWRHHNVQGNTDTVKHTCASRNGEVVKIVVDGHTSGKRSSSRNKEKKTWTWSVCTTKKQGKV